MKISRAQKTVQKITRLLGKVVDDLVRLDKLVGAEKAAAPSKKSGGKKASKAVSKRSSGGERVSRAQQIVTLLKDSKEPLTQAQIVEKVKCHPQVAYGCLSKLLDNKNVSRADKEGTFVYKFEKDLPQPKVEEPKKDEKPAAAAAAPKA